MLHLQRKPSSSRDINLEKPLNRWRFFLNWLFDSLIPGVLVVSTVRASSLKSPVSIWRGVVFVAFIVGMMTIGRGAWAFSCSDVTEISEIECEALVALYDSTNGANWSVNTGWKDTNTPCSWHGVACIGGEVSKISLPSNQVNGSIPNLTPLTGLIDLWLQNNQLSGIIPVSFSTLTNLRRFHLHTNQLTGPIPDLTSLGKLEEFSLHTNPYLCRDNNIDYSRWSQLDNVVICVCEHATYSLKKRTLTVPFIEIPVVDFLTGLPTGEKELWKANLRQIFGTTNRFRLLYKTVTQITDDSNSSWCPANYAVETGTLSIPYIDVPIGIALGNKKFENGVDVFKATMTWEPIGRSFVVQEIEQLPQL